MRSVVKRMLVAGANDAIAFARGFGNPGTSSLSLASMVVAGTRAGLSLAAAEHIAVRLAKGRSVTWYEDFCR